MATHSSILAWRIPMDRGAWRATVHGVAKSQTRLKRLSRQTCTEKFLETRTHQDPHPPNLEDLQPQPTGLEHPSEVANGRRSTPRCAAALHHLVQGRGLGGGGEAEPLPAARRRGPADQRAGA